jgi:hypothetical protein
VHIVTRAEWNARPPKSRFLIATKQPKLILHHAAGSILPNDGTVSATDLRRIKGIQDYHMDRKNWSDIAYSFVLDPDGYLFEGRGVGVANGATKGHGTTSYAVCVMGNYDLQEPSESLLTNLGLTAAWGHTQGYWPLGYTGGHRDYGSTSCPGSKLYKHLTKINNIAKEIYNMATRFEDVPQNHTHYAAIEWLAANGITKGTNPPKNTLFSPDRAVTRAEFATLLKRYHDKFPG